MNFSSTHMDLWNNVNLNVTSEDTLKILTTIKENKNPGPMQINIKILREGGNTCLDSLTNVLNAIIDTAIIPDNWKTYYIIPIPKPGNPELISNYRGIAIQSILPKLLDKILTEKMYEALYPLLDPQQHGFCKNRVRLQIYLNTLSRYMKTKLKNLPPMSFTSTFRKLSTGSII